MTGLQVKYAQTKTRITGSLALVAPLPLRYPRATAGVVDALTTVLALLLIGDGIYVAGGVATALFLGLVVRDRRRYVEPPPEPDHETDPVDWFVSICRGAHIHPPLVLHHWPTESGHGFYVLVTHDVGTDKAPITVEAFAERASLLRDVAGIGCRGCQVERDVNHGGRATVYFNGVRLQEWWPDFADDDDEVDPTTEITSPAVAKLSCSVKGCDEMPTVHVVTSDLPNLWVCAEHVDPSIAHLGGGLDWHEWDDQCHQSRCLLVPSPDEADRECTPDSEPLLPLHLREIGAREGSGVASPWPPPVVVVEAPAQRRPAGAGEGSKGARVFDLLAAAQGPLRRGTMAEHADLSPGYVDKLLTAWADVGAVQKIGQLWQVTPLYRDACTLPFDGSEETSGE